MSESRSRASGAPILLDAAAVRAAVEPSAAIDAMQRAFAALGEAAIHPPQSLGTALGDGTFHVKVCASLGGAFPDLYVAKVNANFPNNPVKRGLPTIQGVVALFDSGDGRLLALLDSGMVTALRTAATTALAIRHLAPRDAATATLVGCGAQGRMHVEALFAQMPRARLFVHDTQAASAESCATWAKETLGRTLEVAKDLRQATRRSQVIITCTPTTTPWLEAGDVPPGALVCAVGADNENKAEIHASLLERSRVIPDLTAQCIRFGDLRQAVEAGLDPRSLVRAELSEIVTGRRSARAAPEDIVVFDSTGLAIQDLALGALVLAKSVRP